MKDQTKEIVSRLIRNAFDELALVDLPTVHIGTLMYNQEKALILIKAAKDLGLTELANDMKNDM